VDVGRRIDVFVEREGSVSVLVEGRKAVDVIRRHYRGRVGVKNVLVSGKKLGSWDGEKSCTSTENYPRRRSRITNTITG
jgi:hypothetical protein